MKMNLSIDEKLRQGRIRVGGTSIPVLVHTARVAKNGAFVVETDTGSVFTVRPEQLTFLDSGELFDELAWDGYERDDDCVCISEIDDAMNAPTRLKYEIFKSGKTYKDVAADAEITPEALSRIVNGKQRPGFGLGQSAYRIAAAVGWEGDVRELFKPMKLDEVAES